MFSKFPILLLFLSITITVVPASSQDDHGHLSFIFNGFKSGDLDLDGIAQITSNGLLRLTNDTYHRVGHAFFPSPITFKATPNGTVSSFSTTFLFGIRSEFATLGGHGIVFVIAPTRGFPGALPSQYLGVFNVSNVGDTANRVVGVELDTFQNSELKDINANHVGIDINDLASVISSPAMYFDGKKGGFTNLSLISGKPMKVWIEYDGVKKQMNVTLAPAKAVKPQKPLLSLTIDLSPIIRDTMYVGFSSSTGSITSNHYVRGWSFKINGEAQELDSSQLPRLPRVGLGSKPKSKFLTIGLPVICSSLVAPVILTLAHFIRRKRKFADLIEDWELEYGLYRYKYKDLYIATKGFKDKDALSTGGLGRVYKGVLPSKTEIAVKRVSHESRQGMRECVAEIASLSRLRHRNVVPLLGYCRRKRELLLVYDYMPNGSLDKYLFDKPKTTLNWNRRFQIIKGVASGLCYLHHQWERVIIHSDVKASNVLLDDELNSRLGDVGLARLYDHGGDPQTTRIVGTLGYLAPEHTRTGKATTSVDVFAFGAFLLEVACGRRPIEGRGTATEEELVLVDWVFSCWCRGRIIEAMDSNLIESDFTGAGVVSEEEVELVLKLGLLCSHSEPGVRPSMKQVVSFLERDVPLPDLSTMGMTTVGLTFTRKEGFDGIEM